MYFQKNQGLFQEIFIFGSRTMRSIVCESMPSLAVAMVNQTALRAAWLCGRAWFLETRLLHTVQVPTFEKNVMRSEIVEHHLWFTIELSITMPCNFSSFILRHRKKRAELVQYRTELHLLCNPG